MTRNQILIIVGLIVFLLIVVAIGVWSNRNVQTAPGTMTGAGGVGELPAATSTAYTPEVPKNAVATVPTASAPAAPDSSAELGIFNVSIDKTGFHPSSLVVKNGNVVQIKATSLDGDYDFYIPKKEMYQMIKKGETKPLMFTANMVGTFLFECRDYCPGGQQIQGTLITVAK